MVQPYVNHDAWLYKVYVLGHVVSVHKRRSLPNLPLERIRNGDHDNATTSPTISRIAFDSQRPYPRLRDFGYDNCGSGSNTASTVPTNTATTTNVATAPPNITADEVQPIVAALKAAFQLELFGFDIICESGPSQTLYVVDVNYFPSYKEVPNFAALLAKFLTDKALERRAARQEEEAEQQQQEHPDNVDHVENPTG